MNEKDERSEGQSGKYTAEEETEIEMEIFDLILKETHKAFDSWVDLRDEPPFHS